MSETAANQGEAMNDLTQRARAAYQASKERDDGRRATLPMLRAHRLIQPALDQLPPLGAHWNDAELTQWLRFFELVLRQTYDLAAAVPGPTKGDPKDEPHHYSRGYPISHAEHEWDQLGPMTRPEPEDQP